MTSTTSPARGHARRSLLRRDGRVPAVLACIAALATACGGPGGSAIPGYVNGTPGSPVAFARCMRAHGVPGFPDPSGGQWNFTGVNPNSPQFTHAVGICGGQSPVSAASQQAQGLAKGLRFARCMRAHGVRNFSDPVAGNDSNGSQISSSGGMDPNSPVFQAALRACRSLLPGGSSGGGNSGSTG